MSQTFCGGSGRRLQFGGGVYRCLFFSWWIVLPTYVFKNDNTAIPSLPNCPNAQTPLVPSDKPLPKPIPTPSYSSHSTQ